MRFIEVLILITTVYAMMFGAMYITYKITKGEKIEKPSILNIANRVTENPVEIVTEEMEADIEERVRNEYNSRF